MTEQNFDSRACSPKEENACALLPGVLAALFSFQHVSLPASVNGLAGIGAPVSPEDLDCEPQSILSLQKALSGFGLSIPYETLQLYVGLDGDQALELRDPSLDAS
jgi:hypothetical protein